MGCCPTFVPIMTNVSLGTATGALASRQSLPINVRGTTLTVSAMIPNLIGTNPSLAVTVYQSFNGGMSFDVTGSTLTMTSAGPDKLAFTGLTATHILVQATLSGTSAYCLGLCVFGSFVTA